MRTRIVVGTALMVLLLVGIAALAVTARTAVHSSVPPLAWRTQLERLDTALEAGKRADAVRAWNDAWGAALATRDWEPMLAVGDAALRLGEATGSMTVGRSDARRAYMAALTRARAVGARDGMLRCAEAFAALGDAPVAESARRMAAKVQP